MMSLRLRHVFHALLALALVSCGPEVAPIKTLLLSLTSDAPTAGVGSLSAVTIRLHDGDVLVPDPDHPDFQARKGAFSLAVQPGFDPVVAPVLVELAYGGETFGDPTEVGLQAVGLVGGVVATRFQGTVDLGARAMIDVHLVAVATDCDADGDGYLDCTLSGCCEGEEPLTDCEPGDPAGNPWGYEDDCVGCDDGVDQDCDGEDMACLDADADGILDCEEDALGCGLDDATVGPGKPELCDGKDNDCDGLEDEGYAIVQDGVSLSLGSACGVGQCAGGVVACLADGSGAACDSPTAPSEEICDEVDNDCDGVTDEDAVVDVNGDPCEAPPAPEQPKLILYCDADGDGFVSDLDACPSDQPLDCDDTRSEVYPGAEEPCCLASLEGQGDTAIAQCDRDCDGVVNSWCAATDADGDGFSGSADCDETDPLVNDGASEKCGDGVDQDCFGGDLPCDGLVDSDGDGWPQGGADCNDVAGSGETIHPGADEICDGIDNDCDGLTDEGNPADPDDADDADKVPGADCGSDVGQCGDTVGTWVCANTQLGSGQVLKGAMACVGETLPTDEVCDTIDNDCDGEADELFVPGGELATYDFPHTADVEALGLLDACGFGACAGGQVQCDGAGGLTCSTVGGDSEEVCDGEDNDCDGLMNDDVVVTIAAGEDPVGTTCDIVGLCGAPSSTVVATCHTDDTGSWSCDYSGVAGWVDGDELTCEGVDENCDGYTDIEFNIGVGCDSDDPDDCEGGQLVCKEDGSDSYCEEAPGENQSEVCDAVDNDCDGATDEDFPSKGQVCDGADSDNCENGTWTCVFGTVELECVNETVTDIEDVCNGLDDDCNGLADQDYKTGGGITYTDLNGDVGLVLGEGCGVGDCDGGEVVCASGELSLVCSTEGEASGEVCDYADNDCDGLIDENAKENGLGTTACDNDLDADLCKEGIYVCAASGSNATFDCDDPGSPDPEVCDLFDNDCDDETDENFKQGGDVTYDFPHTDATEALVLGESCGVGECANGTVACNVADPTTMRCTSQDVAILEICDGKDNDCDGLTDEDFPLLDSACDSDDSDQCANGYYTCTSDHTTVECLVSSETETDIVDVCDGSDNDCDGSTDEDYLPGGSLGTYDFPHTAGVESLGKGEGCGVGDCADGQVVCEAGGLTCSTVDNDSAETCNTEDDDCDGLMNDGVVVTIVDGVEPVNTTCSTSGVCGAGGATVVATCVTDDSASWSCDYTGVPNYESGSEGQCDGADNDCDGDIDEDFEPGGPLGTYDFLHTVSVESLGLGQECGVGDCAGGAVQCDGSGGLTCSTVGDATAETCDEDDNDCDASVDEDFMPGAAQGTYDFPHTSATESLGKGNTCGTGDCAGGLVVCQAGGLGCTTFGENTPETCDGFDDDCDSLTDENFKAGGDVTYDFPHTPATETLVFGDLCGVGECLGGQVQCSGTGGLMCTKEGENEAEVCDGNDNDCDGVEDDPFYDGTVTLTDLDGALKNKDQACGVGICAGGVVICSPAKDVLTCTSHVASVAESCDALDNDCDGATDENFKFGGDQLYQELHADVLKALGQTCGAGECADGYVVCGGGVATCDTIVTNVTGPGVFDRCDELDNDCDGIADEPFYSGPGASVESWWWSGSGYLPKEAPCGEGACAGAVVCATAFLMMCDGPAPTADTDCDGVDDDCDGEADEGYEPTLNGKPPQTTCGTGDCLSYGEWKCEDSEQVDTCVDGAAASSDATCDGNDDDCDGQTDENYVSIDTACGVGACAATGESSCVDGEVLENCTPGDPSPDTTCDGVDDDCDGELDDNYISILAACGEGECASDGVTSCFGGDVIDNCTPDPVTGDDADCNGDDDDCDGLVDEHYESLDTSCGTGACASTGSTSCADGVVVDSCTPGPAASGDSTCDGVDDDCSGDADEDYVATSTSCGVGQCLASGVQTCVDGAVQDSCVPKAPLASDSDCDGVDDDCDGVADQDYVPPGTSCGLGVCASEGQMGCQAGVLVDTCEPGGTQGTDALCDGDDDDCDGQIDEHYDPEDTSCGVGVCASTGTTSCVDGIEQNSCTVGSPTGDDEDCNGYDENCDGDADDGYSSQLTSCGVGACASDGSTSCIGGSVVDSCVPGASAADDATCDDSDNDCDGDVDEDFPQAETTCGTSDCTATGFQYCEDGVVKDSCAASAASGDDANCNGVDDDCDGETDELYAPVATGCGVGACASDGVTSCVAGAVQDSCVKGTDTDDDNCDGIDNDCDGEIDEHYVAPETTCGQGVCASTGVLLCTAGGATVDTCTEASTTGVDNDCNGVDEDCDGTPDEHYESTATSCGVGACEAAGAFVCVQLSAGEAEVQNTCAANASTDDDSDCDGVDDDCDGAADEHYVPQGCGLGLCAATAVSSSCADGVETTCKPGASASDANCNGVDDDCDGAADEDYVHVDGCGVGYCGGSNDVPSSCSGGVETACAPGDPLSATDATCDGVDDDCDGVVDEDYLEVATTCGDGTCQASGTRTCQDGVVVDSCEKNDTNGVGCDDGDDCTSVDTCSGGVCGGTPMDCMDDENPCTDDICDGGGCGVNNTDVCDDGVACTELEMCSGGACVGTADAGLCDDGEPCTVDSCNAAMGCDNDTWLSDGTTCDDGDACTSGDMCTTGTCGGVMSMDDTTCDGVDDDCDGVTDEDAPEPCAIGVFFSEYVEAYITFGNDALELYNATGHEVALEQCGVDIYSDGDPSASEALQFPAGTVIAAGGTLVLCNENLDGSEVACGLFWENTGSFSNLSFSGNDVLAFWCGAVYAERVHRDFIGQVGDDPGSIPGEHGWQAPTEPNLQTKDRTLRRKCHITRGDEDAANDFQVEDLAAEWMSAGTNTMTTTTYSGLGSHSLCPPD